MIYLGFKMRNRFLPCLLLLLCLCGCARPGDSVGIDGFEVIEIGRQPTAVDTESKMPVLLDIAYGDIVIPVWDGVEPYVEVNGNQPFFTDTEKSSTEPFETYSEQDTSGRCGTAYANICRELMPTKERGAIGSVWPSGWHTVKYNDLISGNYLYNRCHLIGFQLAGENANPENLITGTRYLNIEGMLPFENMVDDYVDETGNHVLYRVTPVYDGADLVARGVLMEGRSVEDNGKGICFCIFAYNVQPGIAIDYATGDSRRLDGKASPDEDTGTKYEFVVNIKSGKFHRTDCRYADGMSESNRVDVYDTLTGMEQAGYDPCGACRPDEIE